MNLNEIYFEEISMLKNVRINRVVQAAKVEFFQHGITQAKIKDIAKRAEVGEASVYRYFADKTAIAKVTAFDYWAEKEEQFTTYYEANISKDDTGLQKILVLLNFFIELYHNHREFLKFIEDFNSYMLSVDSQNRPANFEILVKELERIYIDLIVEGQNDGSINKSINPIESYAFISQVMLSTTQKLASKIGYLVTNPKTEYSLKCLNNLIDMFIQYIKA